MILLALANPFLYKNLRTLTHFIMTAAPKLYPISVTARPFVKFDLSKNTASKLPATFDWS